MNLLDNIKWYKTPKNLIKKYYRIKKHKSKKKRKQLYKDLKLKVVESSSKQECYKIEGKFCDCSGLCRESY